MKNRIGKNIMIKIKSQRFQNHKKTSIFLNLNFDNLVLIHKELQKDDPKHNLNNK